MWDVLGVMVGVGRVQVLFCGRFVTKCFGSNIYMGLFVGGCGFPDVSKFVVWGFCSGALLIGP